MYTTKKLMTLMLALLALTMFTACDSSDEPDVKENYTITVNNRAYWDGVVVFSQSTAQVELNLTANAIKISTSYKDLDGQTRTLTTPVMKMTASSGTIFSFLTTDDLGNGVKNLYGHIDTSTRMMRYAFQQDNYSIICTTHLLFKQVGTSISDETHGIFEHNLSDYLFILDSKAETCTMQISDFVLGVDGDVQASTVEYKGLNMTITELGYIISAPQATATQGSYYNLTDVNVTIDRECTHFFGSFKTGVSRHQFQGNLFFDY